MSNQQVKNNFLSLLTIEYSIEPIRYSFSAIAINRTEKKTKRKKSIDEQMEQSKPRLHHMVKNQPLAPVCVPVCLRISS